MTLVVGLMVVSHHTDVISWALLGGVHGGASAIGHNSMTLVAGLVVVPHLTDVILRALL